LVVLPIASALRATGIGHQPTGDAVLFAPGGVYLLETLRLGAPALTGALPVSTSLVVIAILLQSIPQGAVIHGLTQPTESLANALQRSLASFPRFLLLGGLGLLAQGCAAILGIVAAQALRYSLGGDARAWAGDVACVLALTVSLLSLCTIGALVDLARCGYARGLLSLSACSNAALRTLLKQPLRLAAAALVPLLGVVALAVGIGFVVGALRVEQGATWRWLTVLALHQLVMLACSAAEVRWLSRADHFSRFL
jgi:hypothetical protein